MGDVAGAEAGARIPAALAEAKGLAPIHTAEAVATAQGVSPIHTQEAINAAAGVAPVTEATHAAERDYDNAHPAPDKPIISIQAPTDPSKPAQVVAVDPRDPLHPRVADVPGVTKGGVAGAGSPSGLTMQTMARMGTSYNDLAQSIAQMEKFENDPAFRAKLTASNKALMAAAEAQPNAEAHGITGVLGNAVGQLASGAAQGHLDPELNTYLNLRQRVGTAFTELLPRPNQQLLQIEKGLSGIDVGWNPLLLTGIQGRRRGGLEVLRNILSKQGLVDAQGNVTGAPGAQSDPGDSGDPDFAALMAKYGKKP